MHVQKERIAWVDEVPKKKSFLKAFKWLENKKSSGTKLRTAIHGRTQKYDASPCLTLNLPNL
jgi:hypothetical protein